MDGNFIKKDEFERIWIAENVTHNYEDRDSLSDDDYIDYYIWKDQNDNQLCKKYLPKIATFKGNTPNIIFHATCLGCISQRNHGINRCKGCKYLRDNQSNLNLHIDGEKTDTLSIHDLYNFCKGRE